MYEEYASDTLTGDYGASMPTHSYYSIPRETPPKYTPQVANESVAAASSYGTPTQRDVRHCKNTL